MRLFGEGKKLFKAKYLEIPAGKCEVFCADGLPEEKCKKAIKAIAPGLNSDSIIGIVDNSILHNASSGAIFSDYKFYFSDFPHKPKKIWYDDIKTVFVSRKRRKSQETEDFISIELTNGTVYKWHCASVNMQPIADFLSEMKDLSNHPGLGYDDFHIQVKDNSSPGATAGGTAAATKGTVNKVFEEEKFHARQGHGFAAERANNFHDRVHGLDAKIVGDDNAKNGADRIVDGIFIQSKYCATGAKCINACFEENGKGLFRYIGKNGAPMIIEVPNDQAIYDSAVETMRQKIINEQVPGVTNPDEAKNLVRRGTVSYKQAVNIAKAGTVDSLVYDAQQATVISASAFGVSAVVSFATSLWNDEKIDVAIKKATFCGLKVGGTAFITSVLASQLAKAGLNSALVFSSEAIIHFIGPKAAAVLINAFRNGANIYGAAAMKSAAKLLRGNTITGAVTFVILSLSDVVNIFRGRISGQQLFKDLANTGMAIAGGSGGYLGGAAVGSIIAPGVGTVIGGLVGAIAVGAGAGKGTDYLISKFIEDDAEKMVAIIEQSFQSMAGDYMLNSVEAEKIVDKLSLCLDGKKLKDMFASKDRMQYASDFLKPLIEQQVVKRHHISLPSDEEMRTALRVVLESIADEESIQVT